MSYQCGSGATRVVAEQPSATSEGCASIGAATERRGTVLARQPGGNPGGAWGGRVALAVGEYGGSIELIAQSLISHDR